MFETLSAALVRPFWKLASRLVPKDADLIALNTFPDFDDTAKSVVEEAERRGKRVVILTNSRELGIPRWAMKTNVQVLYKYSVAGFRQFHRSRFVIFTHGLYTRWPRSAGQTILNVWHGMPIKRIGLLLNPNAKTIPFDFTISYSQTFDSIIAEVFGVPGNAVLRSKHPRMDQMTAPEIGGAGLLSQAHHLAVWLPTYRRATVGDIRLDGSEHAHGLSQDLTAIDELLVRLNCKCLVKAHPMARLDKSSFGNYKNIVYIDEDIMSSLEISLYQILGRADILVTDVSSVYFDFMDTGRNSILYCPDIEEYEESRGFVLPVEQLVDQRIIETEMGLLAQLEVEILALAGPRPASVVSAPLAITASLFDRVGIL